MNDKHKGANPYDDISKRTTGHHPKLGWMIGGATVAVVVVIGLLVIFLGGDDGEDSAGGLGDSIQETAEVTISGEDLPAMADSGVPAAGADEAVGLAVPKLVGQSFDGSDVTIDGSDGNPKMVVFLAHHCPHCQAEVPVIQQWIDDGGAPEGLEIYGVATGQDPSRPNYPPSDWLKSEGWSSPVLADDDAQSAAQSWGLSGYPYFVMVDADGNVWQRASGELPVEEIDRLADELMSGNASTGGSSNDQVTDVDLDN